MMADPNNSIACFGWVDGSPVQILTTADGSVSASTVYRKLGKEPIIVKAPLCLKRYNQRMQGVNRHDQLRATFSLVARHGFKKYYVKILLGLVGMAIMNAFIHFKLMNPYLCNKSTERYDFMNGLAHSLCTTNWNEFGQSSEGRTTDTVFQALCLSKDGPYETMEGDITIQQEEEDAESNNLEDSYDRCFPVSYKNSSIKKETRGDLTGAKCASLKAARQESCEMSSFALNTLYKCAL